MNLRVQFCSDLMVSAAVWQPVIFPVSYCCWPQRCSRLLPSHVFRYTDISFPSCRSADWLNCCNIHRRQTDTYLRMILNCFAFNVLLHSFGRYAKLFHSLLCAHVWKVFEYLDKYKEINFSTVLLYIAYIVIDKLISLGSRNYGYLRPRVQSKS